MGNSSPPPKKKEPTLDEIVLDLKMASKRFQSESNRAMKDKEK
jgi:charged multivesicular body protein 1